VCSTSVVLQSQGSAGAAGQLGTAGRRKQQGETGLKVAGLVLFGLGLLSEREMVSLLVADRLEQWGSGSIASSPT